MTPEILNGMFRLRYEIFYRRLGWAVDGTDGLERDRFDDLGAVYVVAVRRPDDTVVGCLRLLPTTGPHMLYDVPAFRPVLQGRPAPRSPRIWEISRLAVAPSAATEPVTPWESETFGPIPRALLVGTGNYARDHGIDRFVTLSSVTVERKANASGIPTTRIGPDVIWVGAIPCTTYSLAATALQDVASADTTSQDPNWVNPAAVASAAEA